MSLQNQIEITRTQVADVQARLGAVTAAFETKAASGSEVAIVEATLADVHAHTRVMDANIADLIIGLDEITSGFSKDFDEMRNKSGTEKFIGIFSPGQVESMRQERLRSASIDDKLHDLIEKSDTIVLLLEGQLTVIEEQKVKVEANLIATLAERETTVATLEGVRGKIAALDPAIISLETRIGSEQDPAERTRLETELAAKNAEHNGLVQEEQVLIATSQTLERYIEKGKTWVDSLQNQAATQMVLINKLKTDTKQRVVLYDALTRSLKTAQQQDIAHRINDIGVKTDQEAQAAMAAIGAATNARMMEMMERHEDHMVFSRKVLAEKAKADERFARRFGEIVRKHDQNLYGAK